MAIQYGILFFKFEARQTTIIVSSGLPHQTQQVQIFKKVRQTAITICRGLLHLTGWVVLPSENISGRFFQGEESL
jgi:hypothetical protein